MTQTLENITGNLRDAYKQAEAGTVLCVDQLMKERLTNTELRQNWFYTADGNVYSMDGKIPTLRITREATNPILKNIDEAFTQLVNNGNYLVGSSDFETVKSALDTVVIDLTKLKLQGNEKEYRYLAVDTSKGLGKYNPEQQKLLTRVFGSDVDYAKVMEMLRTPPHRINETKVYVLAPDYVKANAKTDPIGRASWLLNFLNYSNFFAVDRNFSDYGRLCGVRREVVVPEALYQQSHERSDLRNASAKVKVPSAPQEISSATIEEILTFSKDYVPQKLWPEYESGVRQIITKK